MRRPPLALTLVALAGALALAGCGRRADAEQARICRMAIPALNPDAAAIRVTGIDSGGEGTLRIDYDVEAVDRAPRGRYVVCRFEGAGLAPGRSNLAGLETEGGPVSGASLHLLKRFWLETPDAVAADPGGPPADVPQVPHAAAHALQVTVAGLPRLAIFGLLSASFALVFGLVGRINLAFGEIAAVGAAAMAVGVAIALSLGWVAPLAGLAAGLPLALTAGALHGAVGGHFAIRRLIGSTSRASLVATLGLSLALMEYLRLAGGTARFWLPPIWNDGRPLARAGQFVVMATPVSLAVSGLGLLAAGALLALLRATRYGRAWRAYADDPRAAALCGVDGSRLLMITLALSGALAGLSGFLVVVQYGGLGYADGFVLGLKALIGAVIGGIGSVPGALVGGVMIGAFEIAWSALMPIEARDIALYILLIAVLALRPGGLLGYQDGTPRRI